MTLYADSTLSGRRPDQPPAALLADVGGPIDVTPETPLAVRRGRVLQAGATVKLGALLTPLEDHVSADLVLRFGSFEGRLAISESGLATVSCDDAEDGSVPVAQSELLAGVTYAFSLTANVQDGVYRQVVVGGRPVSPEIVDLVPGPQLPDESYMVDVLTGGQVDTNMPEWVKETIRRYTAEELLAIAREQGGRFEVTRAPSPEVERVPRPAPLVSADGGPAIFTFSVESDGLTVERIWAVEA